MPVIVIPAADVLHHRAVQLVGGRQGTWVVDLPDVREVAMGRVARGAPYLHLEDLDGSSGRGDRIQRRETEGSRRSGIGSRSLK
jgi:phosphoribosylformimino-5-aminoimidazole carboxamide ribotide isomerase